MDKVDPNDPKLKRRNIGTAIVLALVAASFFAFFIWYIITQRPV